MADVTTPTAQYNICVPAWQTVDALWGGTRTMREAGKEYLPREEAESDRHYQNRLLRSTLFNAFRDAVMRIVAKPFSRVVNVEGEEALDPRLQDLISDCDMLGASLTQFARELMEDAVKYGVAHFLVDYPQGVEAARLDQERTQGIRPYFVRISPLDAIEASGERFRVKDSVLGRDGEWGQKTTKIVRVYEPGSWRLFDDKRDLQASGVIPFQEMPIVSVCFRRRLGFYGEPTLEDLAWLNVAHWQSSSDQRNLLSVARVPILYEQGVSATDLKQAVEIGSTTVRRTSARPGDSDLKWVEPTGAAMGSGFQDIQELERRMEVLGIQPFIRQTGSSTATASAIDESNVDADIQSWIRVIEAALVRGFERAAAWIGAKLPADFACDVWNEFGLTMRAQTDATLILQAYAAGALTKPTLLSEWQRRGILWSGLDIEKEADESDMTAELGTMGEDPPADPMGATANADGEPAAT